MIRIKFFLSKNEKWIKELETKILIEEDKILFDEATNCFLSGNLRASYILSWLSIIESLKRKLFQFANMGDSKSDAACKKIDLAETQKQPTDKIIIEESIKCGIIEQKDFGKIIFFWEQRCLFAHPYHIQPGEEEVKHIIAQSVETVLGKELLFDKNHLIDLIDNIVKKPYYLPNDNKIIREFAKNKIAKIPEKLHPFFFKSLLFQIGEFAKNGISIYEFKKLRFFIIELFLNSSLKLENRDWTLEVRATNHPYESFIGYVHPETWKKLPKGIQEMLVRYLLIEQDTGKFYYLGEIFKSLIKEKVLENKFLNKYFKYLNKIDFDFAINYYGLDSAILERLGLQLKCKNYDKENQIIEYIKSDKSKIFLNSLNHDDQFYLGRLIVNTANNGNWKTKNFLENLKLDGGNLPEPIKSGIAFGCFFSLEEKYLFNKNHIIFSLVLLNQIETPIAHNTFNKILERYRLNPPTKKDLNGLDDNKFEELINLKDEINNWSNSNKSDFESLLDIIQEKLRNYSK